MRSASKRHFFFFMCLTGRERILELVGLPFVKWEKDLGLETIKTFPLGNEVLSNLLAVNLYSVQPFNLSPKNLTQFMDYVILSFF